MRTLLVILSAALALATTATSSDAQCNFARPPRTKARNLELAMVPAHVVCGEFGGLTPNTTSEGLVPACTPPQTPHQQLGGSAADAWVWGPTTYAKVQVYAKTSPTAPANPNDPLNPIGDTADIQVKLWLRDVMNDGIGLANSSGHLCITSRMTTNDRANGDQTWIDVPICLPVTLTNGDNANVGYVTYSVTKWMNDVGQPGLTKCAVLDMSSFVLQDGNGHDFAVPGVALY